MTITPQGVVYLCQSVLEQNYKNTIDFTSIDEQSTYFNSIVKKQYTDYTYVKKDGTITVGENIDKIINCNYLFYKNNGFTNKTYYCFITNMEYLSENSTRISFITDVYQTWLFDFQFQDSFIEREHVKDDTIGLHTIPENLEQGETILVETPTNINNYDDGTYLCMGVTEMPKDISIKEEDLTKTYNGIYSGLYYMIFTEADYCTNMIRWYTENGKADAINCLFLVPKSYAIGETANLYIGSLGDFNYAFLMPLSSDSYINLVENFSSEVNSTLAEGYTPKNNKLFTYPFNYSVVSNNNGADVIFKYEDFISNILKFKVVGALSQGCSIKCVPLNYKKISDDNTMNCFNFGINGGKFPICSWSSDTFTNWLVSNSLNIAISTTGNIFQIASGAANPTDKSGLVSGIMGVANTIGQVYQHSLIPDQVKGNTNSGEITYSANKNVFTLFKFSIRKEYAEVIDNYFSMYGYKINKVKIPNLTGRSNWNYVKTINSNITGNIPQIDIEELKRIFDNGITIWHNPNTYLDYNQTNNII